MSIFLAMAPFRANTKPYYYTSQTHSRIMAFLLAVFLCLLYFLCQDIQGLLSSSSWSKANSLLIHSRVLSIPCQSLFHCLTYYLNKQTNKNKHSMKPEFYLFSYSLSVYPHRNGSFIKAENVSALSCSLLNL